MPNTEIAVINASTVLTDDQVKAVLPALQTQVSRDFAPVWGPDAALTFVATSSAPPAGSWWLGIFDNSDQAGALGYHDLTAEGLPLGKAFAGSDMQYGYQWTVTASHELLEMLADPDINLTVFAQADPGSGVIYMHEVCDACEADQYAYPINGIQVSDFVFPAWFESFRATGSTQFDQGKRISAPYQLLQGGYIGVFDVTAGTGWQQVTAAVGGMNALNQAALAAALLAPGTTAYDMRPRIGSRRERRRTPRSQWLRSAPKGPASVLAAPAKQPVGRD
jgi:hypothetical protein